ncbi:MAG TPA: hypothetical protein DEQ80_03575 [Anaerolinea thermolimosa]|uniref:MPN domain-containing protein n=2 Tax=Anaerolinea thermolimosa TaxID=229919 RepID=A0A3D1JEC7_9CHLR|nr:hypothetical protein [Anaerolinea thermolimosa]
MVGYLFIRRASLAGSRCFRIHCPRPWRYSLRPRRRRPECSGLCPLSRPGRGPESSRASLIQHPFRPVSGSFSGQPPNVIPAFGREMGLEMATGDYHCDRADSYGPALLAAHPPSVWPDSGWGYLRPGQHGSRAGRRTKRTSFADRAADNDPPVLDHGHPGARMNIRLTRSHLQQMVDHATQCLPEEACGLIGGVEGEARLIVPVTNSLHSAVRFRMEPHEQLRAFQRFETEGLELLAIYHSHPTGPPTPSETDRAEFSYPGVAYIILSGASSGWQWNAFQLDNQKVTPCMLEIADD